ncbi:MAG: DNA repair protein RecN [Chlorobi bacterium]|nr:DNA repair protein RecN [Chlorobiota bacterium]
MLKTLYIRDYAIIDELTIEFSSGLNVITGETGTGKSILIDALGLLLGERASSEDVRKGSRRSVVEGFFSISSNDHVHTLLKKHGYEDGDELIIRREVSPKSGSRAFLNDSPTQVSLLKEIGDRLIDLHGQHDHQTLLRSETHIHLLDNAGGLQEMVNDYRSGYENILSIAGEIKSLLKREAGLRQKLEFYEFQLQEIHGVDPKPDEDEDLLRELKIRENSEQLYELVTGLHSLLYEESDSVRDKLLRAQSMLDQLTEIDSDFSERLDECLSAIVVIEEIAKSLQRYSVNVEFAPEELEEIRERLYVLNGLRKKFGGTLQAVLEYRETITTEIALAKNYDSTIEEKRRELRDLQESVGKLSLRLSQKRSEIARKIEAAVVETLRELGIEHGKFSVQIDHNEVSSGSDTAVCSGDHWYAATRHGIDIVEFFISTNLGEDPKPLARTASGGEISRVMLALKTILAKNDRLPLLVFDEIDTGISGRIATKVGTAMRNLADYHQIIAITHLPQIAAMSRNHYVVEKLLIKGRTVTQVRKLEPEEHTREVAKLVSGEDVTESSMLAARELIES